MVEDIKQFPSELKAHLLPDGELLEQTGVEVDPPWQVQRVAPDVPES